MLSVDACDICFWLLMSVVFSPEDGTLCPNMSHALLTVSNSFRSYP